MNTDFHGWQTMGSNSTSLSVFHPCSSVAKKSSGLTRRHVRCADDAFTPIAQFRMRGALAYTRPMPPATCALLVPGFGNRRGRLLPRLQLQLAQDKKFFELLFRDPGHCGFVAS